MDPQLPARDRGGRLFWCRTMGDLALYRDPPGADPIMQAGKPLALLAYVALSSRPSVSKEHVAELFWRGSSPQEARHSLSQALYRLRSAAEGVDLVHTSGNDLEISDQVRLDCLEGERAAEAGDLALARELIRGQFLAGFSLTESWEFEDWAETQRQRFAALTATIARELGERLLKEGRPEEALEAAETLAEIRPLDDDSIRLVMAALAASGRHAAATARFAAYAQRMQAEDEEPGEELLRYAAELARYVRVRRRVEEDELPFVGREKEWAVVESALRAAGAGKPATVLVEGSAGLGKSRLLRELARRAETAGGLVLFAKCYEPEQAVPYGAMGDALSGVVGHPALEKLNHQWLAEAARILPGLYEQFGDLSSRPPSEGSQAARRRLHEAIARLIELLASDGPVLLAVDDIHWADPATLELLHFLSHRIRGGVLIVASYRPAELGPMARRYARSLCSSGLAELVVLEPLSESHVRTLLESRGQFRDAELAGTLARHLHRQSGGSPLFLSELFDALARRRILYLRDGVWVLGSDDSIRELPQTIGKMLTDRLDGLVPWMRACAEVAAVANDELPVEVLARALDISEPRAELALSVLEEERLVRRTAANSFDLIHDELRRLTYQSIPDERRRALHASVGSALEALGEAKRPGGPARLVYHFDQANDPVRARRYALSAAEEASALSSPESAQQHLDIAAAHAPRALPPSSSTLARTRGLRRRISDVPVGWLITAAVLALASGAGVTSIVEGRLLPGFRPPGLASTDYRQGTLYLGRLKTAPLYRLRWPRTPGGLGRVEALRGHPTGVPPSVLSVPTSGAGQTHNKLEMAQGGDTIRLTSGLSDDAPFVWSPDGRRLLIARGWRSGEGRFVSPLFVLNPRTRHVRQITETRYQDAAATWSPLGTRIAFRRDSMSNHTVWLVDADGRHAENLTERFHLPPSQSVLAFSPDGRELAVASNAQAGQPATIEVLNLAEGIGRTPAVLPNQSLWDIAWSPDGRWLAYVTQQDATQQLWAVPAVGGEAPRLLADLGTGRTLRISAWTGREEDYVDKVKIESGALSLEIGQSVRLRAIATDRHGATISVPIRWSALNGSIARTDALGLVAALQAGVGSIVASAGGFRSDTVAVAVSYAPVDTLLMEDWSHGLDTLRWRLFGRPLPLVRALPREHRHVFLSNGDYNHPSGVISRASFDPWKSGLTIESEGHFHFTGNPWQYWELGVVMGKAKLLAGTELGTMDAFVGVRGPRPVETDTTWTCGQHAIRLNPEPKLDREWTQIALQILPDGVVECYVEGALIGRTRVDASSHQPIVVVLGGSSVDTDLYHGRVVVTRGLRY